MRCQYELRTYRSVGQDNQKGGSSIILTDDRDFAEKAEVASQNKQNSVKSPAPPDNFISTPKPVKRVVTPEPECCGFYPKRAPMHVTNTRKCCLSSQKTYLGGANDEIFVFVNGIFRISRSKSKKS